MDTIEDTIAKMKKKDICACTQILERFLKRIAADTTEQEHVSLCV